MTEYSEHVIRIAEYALERLTELRMRGLRPTRIRINPIDYKHFPTGARALWGVPLTVDPKTRVFDTNRT